MRGAVRWPLVVSRWPSALNYAADNQGGGRWVG